MNKKEIIEAVKALPVKERLQLVNQLGQLGAKDADYFSAGRADNTAHYDEVLKDAEPEKKADESKVMTTGTHAGAEVTGKDAVAEKAITPDDVKHTDHNEPGKNLKDANKEQGLPENAAPGANAQHNNNG